MPFFVLACRVKITPTRRDLIKNVFHTGAERVYCTVELTFLWEICMLGVSQLQCSRVPGKDAFGNHYQARIHKLATQMKPQFLYG